MVQSWKLGIGLCGLSLAILGTPLSISVEVKAEGHTTVEDTSAPSVKQPAQPKGTQSKPAETATPPSAQKLALIQRLLVLTEQKKNSEQHLESVLTNMEETLPKLLANVIRTRTQLEGDALLQQVTTTTQRLIKRYRELLPSRVNIGEITEEISTNLYAKYYTERELQDLIDFYETPTGRKTISTLPQLTKEALEQSNNILLPEITQLLQQIMQEEFGPAPLKNPPKQNKN